MKIRCQRYDFQLITMRCWAYTHTIWNETAFGVALSRASPGQSWNRTCCQFWLPQSFTGVNVINPNRGLMWLINYSAGAAVTGKIQVTRSKLTFRAISRLFICSRSFFYCYYSIERTFNQMWSDRLHRKHTNIFFYMFTTKIKGYCCLINNRALETARFYHWSRAGLLHGFSVSLFCFFRQAVLTKKRQTNKVILWWTSVYLLCLGCVTHRIASTDWIPRQKRILGYALTIVRTLTDQLL